MMGVARRLAAVCLALGGVMLVGCGSEEKIVLPTPTPTATPTPAPGPVITFIGLATPSDYVIEPDPPVDGVPVYAGRFFATGRGFRIVIEGKPGLSGADPGIYAYGPSDTELPDLQVIVSQQLGNGSEAVCDVSGPNPEGTPVIGGGVPATDPPSFEPAGTVAPRVNDLSCRFTNGSSGQPPATSIGRTDPTESCVKDRQTGTEDFVNPESTIQFCADVDSSWRFRPGRTLVTARLRDVEGNVGPPAQISVEVTP